MGTYSQCWFFAQKVSCFWNKKKIEWLEAYIRSYLIDFFNGPSEARFMVGREFFFKKWYCTHIESPRNFVWFWIGSDTAFKIHIITFFDVGSVQRASQIQYWLRYVYKEEKKNVFQRKKNRYTLKKWGWGLFVVTSVSFYWKIEFFLIYYQILSRNQYKI